MGTNDQRIIQLAQILALSPDALARHLIQPLAAPIRTLPPGWLVPEICQRIFAVTDGFWLFGQEPWNGFQFWDSQNYSDCSGELHQQAIKEGLFPIFGEIPHLTSISHASGSVVASDWEVYQQPQNGWGKVIAPSLEEYLQTLVSVRECYGSDGGHPADWWHPYASHGTRYDSDD